MSAYYNEFEPYAAQWIRNLIKAGLIPNGEVDERSIRDVSPEDLRGFTQCHFFAGLAGWGCALRLAGWPDDREIWTGSPPCQPFSVAGKRTGTADDRHLWPDLFRLIRARRPVVFMGEQVAAAIGMGWVDGVRLDLESEGYASRFVSVPACAVNAPHRRDRLWFVADRQDDRRERVETPAQPTGRNDSEHGCGARVDADKSSEGEGREQRSREFGGPRSDSQYRNFWHDSEWINGADGKIRRVKPGIRLLAHGVPARVGRLRAYGNAIVPQVAAEVIKAYMDVRP